MATVIKPNTILVQEGQRINSFTIILEGTVQVETPYGNFNLEKGDIIGLLDINSTNHSFSYRSITETYVSHCHYKGPDSLAALLTKEKEFFSISPISMIRQTTHLLDLIQYIQYEADNFYLFLTSTYINYKLHSKANSISFKPLPEFDQIASPKKEEHIHPWMIQYYESLHDLTSDAKCLFEKDTKLATGLLLNFSKDATECLRIGAIMKEYQVTLSSFLLNENKLDFFDLYSDLFIRISKYKEPDAKCVTSFHQLVNYLDTSLHINSIYWQTRYAKHEQSLAKVNLPSDNTVLDESVEKNLSHSFDQILDFSGCEKETSVAFKKAVQKYMALPDRSDTSDESIFLYKEIASYFYTVYTAAFQISLASKDIPTIIKMFFFFGYIDENLCGIENSEYLYSIANNINSDPTHGIYTFYDWLRAIYAGEKEPSRNEFEIDYTDYIHELVVSEKIDKEVEEKMKHDGAQKVMYELYNMFPLVNRITCGKISNFTPVLSEHNILRQLQDTLVTARELKTSLSEITNVDFSAYCREVVYSNPEIGITRDFIQQEVLPDIILMPNSGARGIAWQEIEGKRRNTPARMMLPILCMNDTASLLLRLTGEFRWEMCKRIQGARWNDVSEHSLVSSYFDYIQFYKKNSNLSYEAKSKIKISLQHSKNSFKESFIQDYIAYMSYEKKGLPKLNKVTREIFFHYCPFTKEICSKLETNPLFKKDIEKHKLYVKHELHRYDLLTKKLTSSGYTVPEEIINQIVFLKT